MVIRAVGENAYQLELSPQLKAAHIHDVFNVNHLRLYSTATPRLDRISAPADDFTDVAPDNPVLVRDEPDDPERRPPSATDVQAVLSVPEAPPLAPTDIPVAQRPDVRRELFLHYVAFTETTLMSAHDRDGHGTEPSSQFPTAPSNEDVMMDPAIYRDACSRLKYKPTIDLFASAKHHQCARYCGPSLSPNCVARNAFDVNWREWRPYANPPWSLIGRVLNKVAHDRVTIMSVIPDWPHAPWYKQWKKMCVRDVTYTTPIYLDANARLRPKPRWTTRIGILDGNLA